MDTAAKQRIKDMRYDIAKLELKLNRTDIRAGFYNDDGDFVNSRTVIMDQLMELRFRLKEELYYLESED